jgi:hypothetical protein
LRANYPQASTLASPAQASIQRKKRTFFALPSSMKAVYHRLPLVYRIAVENNAFAQQGCFGYGKQVKLNEGKIKDLGCFLSKTNNNFRVKQLIT